MSMTISMDDALKAEFSEICAEIGMSASTAVTIFAKKVVRDKRIPFELTSEPDSRNARMARAHEEAFASLAWEAYEGAKAGQTHDWQEVLAARSEKNALP